jgi:hypothetical protein
MPGAYFPLSANPIAYDQNGNVAALSVQARICTLGDFAAVLRNEDGVLPGVNSKFWGRSDMDGIAIVPIRAGMEQHQQIAAWTLLFMEYPHVNYEHQGQWQDSDDIALGLSAVKPRLHIPGPTRWVLFVLVDEERAHVDLTYTLTNAVGLNTLASGVYAGNWVDISYILRATSGLDNAPLEEDLPIVMQWWREFFGDTDDFLTAYTIAADVSALYIPLPTVGLNNADLNVSYFSFLSRHGNNVQNTWPYYAPTDFLDVNWTQNDLDVLLMCGTSASGITPGTPAAVRQCYSITMHDPVVMISIAGRLVDYTSLIGNEFYDTDFTAMADRIYNSSLRMASGFDYLAQLSSVSLPALIAPQSQQ